MVSMTGQVQSQLSRQPLLIRPDEDRHARTRARSGVALCGITRVGARPVHAAQPNQPAGARGDCTSMVLGLPWQRRRELSVRGRGLCSSNLKASLEGRAGSGLEFLNQPGSVTVARSPYQFVLCFLSPCVAACICHCRSHADTLTNIKVRYAPKRVPLLPGSVLSLSASAGGYCVSQ